MEAVILLNGDYTPLGVISWRNAVRLIVKKKVEVVKQSTITIHNNTKNVADFFLPLVIRLLKFIRQIYRTKVTLNKRNILIRDGYVCQYCGKKLGKDASIDHVIPKSKGGKSHFNNLVACCFKCNNKKDNRLPSQAKMFLIKKPSVPTINEFMLIRVKESGMSKYLIELGIL